MDKSIANQNPNQNPTPSPSQTPTQNPSPPPKPDPNAFYKGVAWLGVGVAVIGVAIRQPVVTFIGGTIFIVDIALRRASQNAGEPEDLPPGGP